jgi:hypothetical protein
MKQVKLHAEVRFHLGKGENFRHWQIKVMQGRKKVDEYYYNPGHYQLVMIGCKLVNNLKKAKKVHKAGKKDVSGWVKCEEVQINNEIGIDNLEKLYYNPIRDPQWRRESDCGEFAWDDSQYATLITQDRQVYILEERE